MNNLKFILPFLAVVLTFTSCSTGPEFERNNENDPNAEDYIPNPPSGLNYQMDNIGNVSLFWEDKTDFEIGYRIYKSLGNNEKFKLLAELEENSTSYIDNSKIFAFPTRYHIVSYSNNTESDTITVDIDFGNIISFEADFSTDYDSVFFSWQSDFYFINVEGFILSKRTDKNSDFKIQKLLPATIDQFAIRTPQDGFVHEFKLSAYNIYNTDTTSIHNNTFPTLSTEPKNLELQLLTPDSLKVTWESISSFDESFQLTLVDQMETETVFLEEQVSSYVFSKQFVMNDKLEVSLSSLNNTLLSPLVKKSLNTTLKAPILEGVQHVSSNELAFSISDPSQVRRETNIFRRSNSSNFRKIGTVKKDDSLFVDPTVSPSKIYTYYASTALSDDSEPINIYFAKSLEKVNRITETEELTRVTIEEERLAYRYDSSKLIFPSNYETLERTIYDVLTDNIILKFYLSAYPKKIIFNNSETKIYTIYYENSIVNVYDFDTGAKIDSVNLGYSDIIDLKIIGNDKLAATVLSDYTDSFLVTVDLKTHSVESIESINSNNPQLVIDKTGEKLLLTNYQSGSNYNYQEYTITAGGDLILDKTNLRSFYTTNFSSDLDTAVVVGSDNLSLFDMDTGERYWQFTHYSISNYCCSNIQLLPGNLLVLQSQYCTYLIDTKLEHNPIIDKQCDDSSAAQQGLISAAGLVYMSMNNENYILDLRRSHMSGYHSFIDVFSLNDSWKEVFVE